MIRDRLGVSTVLGLTATAPNTTVEDIAGHLRVCTRNGVIRGPLLPKNLVLSVSKDANRDQGREKWTADKAGEGLGFNLVVFILTDMVQRTATVPDIFNALR